MSATVLHMPRPATVGKVTRKVNGRTRFIFDTHGLEGFKNLKVHRSLEAYEYAPGLIMHESVCKTGYTSGGRPKFWTIAHRPTGLAVVCDKALGLKKAKYVAGVLAALPINWSLPTSDSFLNEFNALPSDLRDLVHRIRKTDYGKS